MECECTSPCLEEHRSTLLYAEHEEVLDELHRAWSHMAKDENTEWKRQDWSTFRAITLRETRFRGLEIPEETRLLIISRGVNL